MLQADVPPIPLEELAASRLMQQQMAAQQAAQAAAAAQQQQQKQVSTWEGEGPGKCGSGGKGGWDVRTGGNRLWWHVGVLGVGHAA